MFKMELNKLKNCGALNSETPLPVILEVCKSYGIKIVSSKLEGTYKDKVLKFVNTFQVPILKDTKMPAISETTEITKIATFINSSVSWSYNTLKRAYNFWISESSDTLYYGDPTPAYPESITLVQCYTICKNLTLSAETTSNELIYYTKLLKNPKYIFNFLISNITFNEKFFDNIKRLETQKIMYILDKNDWNLCKNLNPDLLKFFIPETPKMAICLSAIYYDLDLSLMKNPIGEYCVLSKEKSYSPMDPSLSMLYAKNPEAFKLSLNFNSNFSVEFYTLVTLQKLVKFEGYIEITDPEYTILQTNTLIPTFYAGFREGIKNIETIICRNPIIEHTNNDIICYGIPGDLIAYTIGELIESFNSNLGFLLPNTQILTPININKLFNISKKLGLQKMISTIKTIRSYELGKNKIMVKLVREYNNTTEENKYKIREMLESLLHLGLSMRGWLGSEEFPIELCPVTDPRLVDYNIINAIIKFETLTSEKFGDLIRNFPLMKYVKGFIYSSSKIDGYTVMERIDIVKEAESSSSCVRLSSNWFCATAYRIYELLKLELPFDITKLRSIS